MEIKDKDLYIVREELLMELEYEVMKEFATIRKNRVTQEELAEVTNIVRQTINRIENSVTSPQISTMIRLLAPLGFTLKIEPLDWEINIKEISEK